MFFASNICCVSSGTVTARYCWLPRAVRGAKPVMKKCRRGNGTILLQLVTSGASSIYARTHVDSKLTKVRVELTRETQASGDTRHDNGDEVVEVAICWCRELQGPEANVVQGLVIDAEGFVGVLDELVNGERRVVWLDDSVGDLGRGDDRVGGHHTVGVLLTDLGDEEGTHARTGTTTERVSDLEAW